MQFAPYSMLGLTGRLATSCSNCSGISCGTPLANNKGRVPVSGRILPGPAQLGEPPANGSEGGNTMKGHIFSITILSVLLVLGAMVVPTNADLAPTSQEVGVSAKTLSGTIEGIDPSQRIVTIQSEEKQGEMMLLAFSDPDVVKGLSKGDRVVVELDDHGMAKKIIKASPEQKDMSTPKN